MLKIINTVALLFQFCWEFPQTMLGVILFAIFKNRSSIVRVELEAYRIFIETRKTGVSLGWFVFWTPEGNRFPHLENDCRMHEYGHARQSVILGPFYLIVVGIPSVCRVFYSRWYFKRNGYRWKNYFNAFPENWADRLGGVTMPGKKKKLSGQR